MSEKTKNNLGIVLIVGILAISYSLIVIARSYSDSLAPSSFRSFTVSAYGKTSAIPDIAQFSFGIITEGGKDLNALQKENSEKSDDIIKFVKTSGVEDKDIKTNIYSVEPRYSYSPCQPNSKKCDPPEIVGYTITESVSVKIRDFSKVNSVLEGVVKNGANSVTSLNFTLDDPSSVESKARTEAIKKARAKAEEVGKAGGFRVGRILSINEGGFYPPIAYGGDSKEFALARSSSQAPSIEPGSEEVRIDVSVAFEIR